VIDGRIVELGSHDELMAVGTAFKVHPPIP